MAARRRRQPPYQCLRVPGVKAAARRYGKWVSADFLVKLDSKVMEWIGRSAIESRRRKILKDLPATAPSCGRGRR